MKRSPVRVFAAACIVAAGALIVVAIVVFGLDRDAAVKKDYLQYWSAEQLLVHGGNPYDTDATLKLERSVGFKENSPLITLSPPVAFFFAIPLGWVDANTGLRIWLLVLLVCLLASVWLVWLWEGRPGTRYDLIGIFFPPVLRCILAGQIGVYFLLEIALFLYLQKSRPFWAGAALVFCSLKPQLFLPCFLVLVLWSLSSRSFRILAGFFAALAISCALTLSLDRHIWLQYVHLARTTGIMNEFLPTLGVWLRFLIRPGAKWIEFLPEAAGSVWAAWYFWTRRSRWDWTDQGLLVLVVSVACSPYSWYTDQAILLPPVVAGLNRSEKPVGPLALFALIAGIGLIALIADVKLTSGFFVWTAPAWLLWYAYARHVRSRRSELAPARA